MGNEESGVSNNRNAIIHAIGGTRYIANQFTAKLIRINDNSLKNYYNIKMNKNQPKQTATQPAQPNSNKNSNSAGKPNTSNSTAVSKGNQVNNSYVAKGGQPNNDPRSRNFTEGSHNSFDAGGKIVARKLWWHESESEKKVNVGSLPKFDAQGKVDHQSDWTPSKSKKVIDTRKLEWRAQPVLNTRENINYVPGGKNKRNTLY